MKFIRRVLRALFSRKMLGRLLFIGACLVTLAALLICEENWRGKRDWDAYVREHEARGERLDIQALIPPPVPDDQNLAMTPLLAHIYPFNNGEYSGQLAQRLKVPEVNGKTMPPMVGDLHLGRHFKLEEWEAYFGGDATDWLKKIEPEMDEITAASQRPYARFPLEYEKGCMMPLPGANILRGFAIDFAFRAEVELHDGRTDAALADARTIFRLAESEKDEPLLLSQLVRVIIWQYGLQVVWEGLESHRWTDAQLAALQEDLARANFLKGLALAFRGERASFNQTMKIAMADRKIFVAMITGNNDKTWETRALNLLGLVPSGVLYQNMLEVNRFDDKYCFTAVDAEARRVYPDILRQADQELADVEHGLPFFGHVIPNWYKWNKVLEAIVVPVLNGVSSKVAFEQVTTDQAVVACALERYRLANGRFPDSLEKLTPAYLKAVQPDVVNGEPPHYRLNGDGTYLLYSDGWDGKDHGGKVVLTPESTPKNPRMDIMKSDWVWSPKPQ